MGKWDRFDEANGEQSSDQGSRPEVEPAKLTETEGQKQEIVATKGMKKKVVDDLVNLRDSVSGMLDSPTGQNLPEDRKKDLQDAEESIDGAVGMISPSNALANQQQESQSMGLGMGGGSSSEHSDED